MRVLLPAVVFERGLTFHSRRSTPHGRDWVPSTWWLVTGRVGDEPFFLSYQGVGVTQWTCMAQLGAGVRQKILNALREQVRFADAPPAWMEVHDLLPLWESQGQQAAQARQESLTTAFYRAWQQPLWGTWVNLAVPFQDKDAAKALGARWNADLRLWQVAAHNTAALQRWPQVSPPAT